MQWHPQGSADHKESTCQLSVEPFLPWATASCFSHAHSLDRSRLHFSATSHAVALSTGALAPSF